MTVKELIEKLNKLPQSSEVRVTNENWEGETKNINDVQEGLCPQYCVFIDLD